VSAPSENRTPGEAPVLILTGPPGVGKTTAAGILSARSDRAVHLEADAFFRFIRSGHVEPWRPESHEQNQVVMRIVAGAAAGYASAGYLTIVEGIVIPGWFLEPLRDALRDAGQAVAYAVLRAPLDACLARVQSREGDPPIDAGAIERIWRSFADLGDLEENALEVGDMDPEGIADLLARRLAAGQLRV
jgi:tRNA uridine 5-carbamoylmethylation protein Kti12